MYNIDLICQRNFVGRGRTVLRKGSRQPLGRPPSLALTPKATAKNQVCRFHDVSIRNNPGADRPSCSVIFDKITPFATTGISPTKSPPQKDHWQLFF
jgi:hypothetical protein